MAVWPCTAVRLPEHRHRQLRAAEVRSDEQRMKPELVSITHLGSGGGPTGLSLRDPESSTCPSARHHLNPPPNPPPNPRSMFHVERVCRHGRTSAWRLARFRLHCFPKRPCPGDPPAEGRPFPLSGSLPTIGPTVQAIELLSGPVTWRSHRDPTHSSHASFPSVCRQHACRQYRCELSSVRSRRRSSNAAPASGRSRRSRFGTSQSQAVQTRPWALQPDGSPPHPRARAHRPPRAHLGRELLA